MEVEVIYKGMPGSEGTPDPPNVVVDDKVLGSKVTFEDLEKVVLEKLQK